ncbi:hypothetical protein GE061_000598 [Apolygus lucorum]|uniref:Uncharacterized protein n=1 Tax=Apolygus lucorum TaxID=248454 RepID=A0A8S9Y6W4_APOLU|nr:hypothetical protein GE061_000598 [Apolygus lucorum]
MDECLKDGMEPKAPDKSTHLNNIENFKARGRCEPTTEAQKENPSPPAPVPAPVPAPAPERTAVSDLDEPGLRALLDEAISYKTPKDAQGKSELFKELLHSVDNDNINPMRVSERSRKPKRQTSKKDSDKSYCSHGSLQDLNNVLSNSTNSAEGDHRSKDSASWKSGAAKPSSSSSPQLINVQDLLLAQGYDEAGFSRQTLVENGSYDDIYQLRGPSKSGSQKQGSASTSFDLPEIRRTLSSGCLEEEPYLEISDSYKSMNSGSIGQSSDKDELSSPALREKFTDKTKNFDENANSLSAIQERKGKCRRLKAKNDKNTILSEHIEGHRSDIAQDIDAVMKYIESPTRTDGKTTRQRMNFPKSSSRIANKLRPVRDKSSDTVRKGRKSKENKFQKSSSLEEVRISTFEDLTSSIEEQSQEGFISALDNSVRNRSQGRGLDVYTSQESGFASMDKTVAYTYNNSTAVSPSVFQKEIGDVDADSDFLTVKKKQRKKKNNSYQAQRNKIPNFTALSAKKAFARVIERERQRISRRKSTSSVPSSEKSDESSDGDSVHSLPISSESCSMRSLGENCLKNASYAAIARAVPSPSKPYSESEAECIDKTVSSPEEPPSPESIPTVMVQLPLRKDKCQNIRITNEDYPPLHHESSNDMYVEYTVSVPKKEKIVYETVVNVEKTVIVKLPPSKSKTAAKPTEIICVPEKRPPVIICDPTCSPCDVQGLEFGFEINHQLLEEKDGDEEGEEVEEEEAEEEEEEGEEEEGENSSESEETAEKQSLTSSFKPVEMVKCADPVVAYVLQEWNKVVDELLMLTILVFWIKDGISHFFPDNCF